MKIDVVNHRLKLSYRDFQDMGEDLSQTTIGNYSVFEKIGQGGFGKVYRGVNDQTKQDVAIKVINIAKINEEPSQRLRQIKLQLARRQDVVMRICDSPNLIKCYDVYQNQSLKLMMIQYCSGGNLQEYIDKKIRIAEKEAILIFKQILNGIAELHSRMIVHRDLKSENIMFHNGILKIADFGFSKQLEQDIAFKHTTLGTITNMAPEVMKRQPYGLKADVWSVGVILFQMVFGDFPFISREKNSLLDEINGSNIYKQTRVKFNGYTASMQMSNFLRQAISVDQKHRLGWKQLLNHPILKQSEEGKVPRSQVVNVPLVAPSTLDCDHQTLKYNFSSFLKNLNVVMKDSDKVIKRRKGQEQNQAPKTSEQDKIFKQMNENLVECLKIEVIYEQIISKIEEYKMLDMQQRECIELMYLLINRCFLSISPINYFMSQKDQTYLFIHQTYPVIHKLYQKVRNTFSKYQKILTKEEDKIGSKISDFFTSKQKLQENNKYMNGIEKIDFKKEEQLNFIQNSYIKKLAKELKGPGQVKQKVKKHMDIYSKINMIHFEHLQKINFDDYIQQMLE